jgi:hypothetical protein
MIGAYRSAVETLGPAATLAKAEQLPALESLSLSLYTISKVFCLDRSAELEGGALEVWEASRRARELADRAMDAKAQAVAYTCAAECALHRLDIDACEQFGQRGLATARRTGTLRVAQFALFRLAWAAQHRGDIEQSQRRLDEAWMLASEVGKQFMGSAILAGMAVLDHSRAAALLDEGEALLAGGRVIAHSAMSYWSYGMQAAFELGDARRLRRFARGLDSYERDEPSPWRALQVERAQLLARLVEDDSDAVAGLEGLRRQASEVGFVWLAVRIDQALAGRNR